MTDEITCYKGQIQAISSYIYGPESQKAIEFGEGLEGKWVSAENILFNGMGKIYVTKGKAIKIEKSKFDELYDKCIEEKKLEKESLDLAQKLFED